MKALILTILTTFIALGQAVVKLAQKAEADPDVQAAADLTHTLGEALKQAIQLLHPSTPPAPPAA